MFALPVPVAYCYEKEYQVLVARRPDARQLTAWRKGVVLEDGYHTQPAQVRYMRIHGQGTCCRVS